MYEKKKYNIQKLMLKYFLYYIIILFFIYKIYFLKNLKIYRQYLNLYQSIIKYIKLINGKF